MKTAVLCVIGVLIIAGLGVGGSLLGTSEAPSAAEADHARQEAELQAAEAAEEKAFDRSRARGEAEGRAEGREAGATHGSKAGKRAGRTAVDEELAATSEPAATTPEVAGLVYDEQLPNGRPGYILPEDQRSIACIGIDAATGECVGD